MEIKDQTMTTETDAAGNEYVSELSATVTETRADGTEVVAEITSSADPDNPTEVESTMTVTETAPDGTETVTEFVANEDGTFKVEEESAIEQALEDLFDVEIGDNLTNVSQTEVYQAEPGFEADGGDFTVGDEMSDPLVFPESATENTVADVPADSMAFENTDTAFTETPAPDASFYAASDAGYVAPDYAATETSAYTTDFAAETSSETTVDAEAIEQEAHVQAATEAQAAADEFIAQGDYEAAAAARGIAENEAWEGGDQSMLSSYDSSDLEFAAYQQDKAEDYSEQQAEYARDGDYESAKEAASDAAYYTRDADSLAGGSDHSGQAEAEEYQMDWAIHEEKQADYQVDNAVYYAESGNFEQAEYHAAEAVEHQQMADYHGDLGEHDGAGAVYDPSSVVSSGGSYEAADYSADYSSVDYSATDTSTDYSSE